MSQFSFCCLTQDLFKRPVLFFSKRSLKQARMSNFSPFCRALLPFHYCLLTGTFLHYYQEARVGIDTFTTYSQPVYTWTLPTAFPILKLLRTGETDMVHISLDGSRWDIWAASYVINRFSSRLPYFFTAWNVKELLLSSFGGTRKSRFINPHCCRLLTTVTVITRVTVVITSLYWFLSSFLIVIVIFFFFYHLSSVSLSLYCHYPLLPILCAYRACYELHLRSYDKHYREILFAICTYT